MARFDPSNASAATDVVGVFDQNFNQVFEGARPIKANVKERSKPMEHPIETGATVTDHRIILPNEIALSVVLRASEYRDVYQQVKQLYEKAAILAVQTRTGLYRDMFIVELPHDEEPDMYDTVAMVLNMKQVQLITVQSGRLIAGTVRNPNNTSTVNRGEQQPGNSGSILSQVFR